MLSKILSLEPRVRSGAYLLDVVLKDGRKGEVDITDILDEGGVFAPLKNPERFCEVRLDPEWHAPVWPNGADICPDVIEERLAKA